MATQTVQNVTRAGVNPTYASAAVGGDEFVNTGKELIHIKNGDSSNMTLTVATQGTVDGQAVADRTVVVPLGGETVLGPFPTSVYNDTNNKVQLTYSSVTSLTLGILNVGV